MITLLGRNVSGKFGGIRLLEKDGTGAALFTLGKLILFMAIVFWLIFSAGKQNGISRFCWLNDGGTVSDC